MLDANLRFILWNKQRNINKYKASWIIVHSVIILIRQYTLLVKSFGTPQFFQLLNLKKKA